MKELTKKILEAGLIDKTTQSMLERWGMIMVHQSTEQFARETLANFIEELELLLQPEAIEKHEVQLDPLINEVYDPTKGH